MASSVILAGSLSLAIRLALTLTLTWLLCLSFARLSIWVITTSLILTLRAWIALTLSYMVHFSGRL